MAQEKGVAGDTNTRSAAFSAAAKHERADVDLLLTIPTC